MLKGSKKGEWEVIFQTGPLSVEVCYSGWRTGWLWMVYGQYGVEATQGRHYGPFYVIEVGRTKTRRRALSAAEDALPRVLDEVAEREMDMVRRGLED